VNYNNIFYIFHYIKYIIRLKTYLSNTIYHKLYIMVKTYVCKHCKFQTTIKTNFKIHTDSIKHQDYVREHTIKCEYCTNNIDKLEISSHYLACNSKTVIDKVILERINEAVNISKTALEAIYVTKLNKLDDVCRAKIIKLEKKNSNALIYKNKEHKKELDIIKHEYKVDIDNMKTEMSSAKAEINSIKEEVNKNKQQHQNEIDKIRQQYDKDIEYYKKELTFANTKIFDAKDKQIETMEQSKVFVTKAKEKELARMETVMKTCGKITEKSVDGICNALTFANAEFTSAPILTKICKFDFVDDYECVDDLLNHYIENTLHIYIGNLIVSLYKKDKAGDQSFWNTDASRLGYIIRQKVDAKILWGKDVNADRITSFIIIPLVNFFIECVDDRKNNLNKFIKKNGDCPKHSKMYDRIAKKEATCRNLIFIKSSLLDTKLSKSIIKYITPKFNISAQISLAKK
jgi:hypothetical protein